MKIEKLTVLIARLSAEGDSGIEGIVNLNEELSGKIRGGYMNDTNTGCENCSNETCTNTNCINTTNTTCTNTACKNSSC